MTHRLLDFEALGGERGRNQKKFSLEKREVSVIPVRHLRIKCLESHKSGTQG